MDIEQKNKILVVDDKSENIFAMTKLLQGVDAEIITAQSGQEALVLILKNHFALILLDVQMPEMDGFETAQLIHANKSTANIPIIFITANNSDPQHIYNGYQSGGVDYLQKPVNKNILLSKVNIFLQIENQRLELEKMALKLKGLSEQNRSLIESAGEGILGFDETGKIGLINPAACKMMKIQSSDVLGHQLQDLFSQSKIEAIIQLWLNSDTFEAVYNQQLYLKISNKEILPIEYNLSPILGSMGQFKGGVLMFQNISERLKLEEHLTRLAKYDMLTGLANRSLFSEFLNTSIKRSMRRKKLTAVMFIDLDHFKPINDNLGHDAGDQILKMVAQRLRDTIRKGDLIARFGGDEFAIVLDDIASTQDIIPTTKKVIDAICKPYTINRREVTIGTSIGIADSNSAGHNPESLLKAADASMYISKINGRNRYTIFDQEIKKTIQRKMLIEKNLENDVKYGKLKLNYQPIINLKDYSLVGMKAHPYWSFENNIWKPKDYLKIVEELKLHMSLSKWTIENAAHEISKWQSKQSNIPLDNIILSIHMQLPKQEQDNVDLQKIIEDMICQIELPTHQLEFEIPEKYLQEASPKIIETLKSLNKQNIKIAINEFGCSNISLNLLNNLPINTIKFDEGVIKNIGKNTLTENTLRTIISLLHDMNINVAADGVETEEQVLFLKSLCCDWAQGSYFKPSSKIKGIVS